MSGTGNSRRSTDYRNPLKEGVLSFSPRFNVIKFLRSELRKGDKRDERVREVQDDSETPSPVHGRGDLRKRVRWRGVVDQVSIVREET